MSGNDNEADETPLTVLADATSDAISELRQQNQELREEIERLIERVGALEDDVNRLYREK